MLEIMQMKVRGTEYLYEMKGDTIMDLVIDWFNVVDLLGFICTMFYLVLRLATYSYNDTFVITGHTGSEEDTKSYEEHLTLNIIMIFLCIASSLLALGKIMFFL